MGVVRAAGSFFTILPESSMCCVPAVPSPGPGGSRASDQGLGAPKRRPRQSSKSIVLCRLPVGVSLWPDGMLPCRTQRICWNTWGRGHLSSSAYEDLNQNKARIRLQKGKSTSWLLIKRAFLWCTLCHPWLLFSEATTFNYLVVSSAVHLWEYF